MCIYDQQKSTPFHIEGPSMLPIEWVVVRTCRRASATQVAKLMHVQPMHARPVCDVKAP